MASESLDQKLREFRRVKSSAVLLDVLAGVGIRAEKVEFLPIEETDRVCALYFAKLAALLPSAERWSAGERDKVHDRLLVIARRAESRRGIWLVDTGTEPVAVEVPLAPLLAAGTTLFVSAASDLQITSADMSIGLCAEVNRSPEGDEFQLVSWGWS